MIPAFFLSAVLLRIQKYQKIFFKAGRSKGLVSFHGVHNAGNQAHPAGPVRRSFSAGGSVRVSFGVVPPERHANPLPGPLLYQLL
jgi:hypothetical protein